MPQVVSSLGNPANRFYLVLLDVPIAKSEDRTVLEEEEEGEEGVVHHRDLLDALTINLVTNSDGKNWGRSVEVREELRKALEMMEGVEMVTKLLRYTADDIFVISVLSANKSWNPHLLCTHTRVK